MLPFLFLIIPILVTPCLVVNRLCQCPDIKTISQAQIKKYPLSAYLGNRNTYVPTWTVGEGCKITVDCSKSPSSNFYFMIFRSDNPPIFNRRFLPTTNKATKFSPTGITCALVDDVYQWQYYGGIVTDMAFAMQPEECGCTDLTDSSAPGLTVKSKLFNTCDIWQYSCTVKGNVVFISDDSRAPRVQLQTRTVPAVVNDLTCVSKTWYYNNHAMPYPQVMCGEPYNYFNQRGVAVNFKWPCNCREFQVLEPANAKQMVVFYDSTGVYQKYTYNKVTITYNTNTCLATPTCTGSDVLVVFTHSKTPTHYPLGSVAPYIPCKPTPLATGGTSLYYWFSDGNMLSEPGVGCLAGCACYYVKMTALNVKRLVGKYSFYNFMASYPIRTPTDNAPAQGCPTTVTCASGYTLVVFDTQTVSTYSTGTLSSVCTVSTRKWTINKATDIPVLSQLYAICVDFRAAN